MNTESGIILRVFERGVCVESCGARPETAVVTAINFVVALEDGLPDLYMTRESASGILEDLRVMCPYAISCNDAQYATRYVDCITALAVFLTAIRAI